MQIVEAMTINSSLVTKVKAAIDMALEYERATNGKRKLGITGEVGEVLACHQLKMRLVLDSRSEGFDAIDKENLLVQIKTRRSESEGLPRDVGRTGIFSKHRSDYALLVLLDHKYELREIWRADYVKLNPVIEKNKRRNPSLSSFKSVGRKVFDTNLQHDS